MCDNMYKSIWNEQISLRKLELRDAKPMLEWMLDPDIYKKMQYNPEEQSLEQCKKFIEKSWNSETELHYAITNSRREYLGTVSLKNVNYHERMAEFAIALCKNKIGKGIGRKALLDIMKVAFEEKRLHKVYLYVRSDNERAVAFYKKNHLIYEGCFHEQIQIYGDYKDIYWFALLEGAYLEWKNKMIDQRGKLWEASNN